MKSIIFTVIEQLPPGEVQPYEKWRSENPTFIVRHVVEVAPWTIYVIYDTP